MSILRRSFNESPDLVENASKLERDDVTTTSKGAEDSQEESVTAALSRLRKMNKTGGGVAISQPLHNKPAESALSSDVTEESTASAEPQAKSMWDTDLDLDAEVDLDSATEEKEVQTESGQEPNEETVEIQRVKPRRAGRARTRLLGDENSSGSIEDMDAPLGAITSTELFAIGWVVVIKGPGRGHSFPLYNGVAQIGRSEDQCVPLDFGDMSISREGHASLAYDEETHALYLGHGGKQNIVRLNNRPVLGTDTVNHGDVIRIGETTLKVVLLCGTDFCWSDEPETPVPSAE